MKRFFVIMTILVGMVSVACSPNATASQGSDDSPENVVLGFLDASFKADQDRVLAFTCTAQRELVRLRFPTTAPTFRKLEQVRVDFSEAQFNITEQTATQATVSVAGNLLISGGGQEAQPIPLAEILPNSDLTTVYEAGKWRICNSADVSLRGLIEAGATDNQELAEGLLCESLKETIVTNPFYELGQSLGADADFTQLVYNVTEWNNNNGFVKIESGIPQGQMRVIHATREGGEWRICSTPETTMRMLLELAIEEDYTSAEQLVCAEQRATIAPQLRTLRQRIIGLVNLEARTTAPPFYESIALLVYETAGIEQRNFRIQVAQVQYALSGRTDASTDIAISGNVRVQTIGLLQNIPVADVIPPNTQLIREDGLWFYCPQPETESTDA